MLQLHLLDSNLVKSVIYLTLTGNRMFKCGCLFYNKNMKNDIINKIVESPIWILFSAIALIYSTFIYYGSIYLNSIDEGDFGRDLYNFYLVSKGNLPYIDFNWIYGPLSPIIYGINFNITGTSIFSALNLWYIIYFIICLLLYHTVKTFSNHFTAFISIVLFIGWHGYRFGTFNHSLGIIFIILAILFLYKYLDSNNIKYLYIVGISCFLLNLVKLNMGIAFSVGLFGTIFIISLFDKKASKQIFLAGILSLLLTILVYGGLWYFSPLDQLAKSFPYFGSYHQYNHLPLLKKFIDCETSIISPVIFFNTITRQIYFIISLNTWLFLAILSGFIICFFIYKKDKLNKDFTFILTLSICALLTTHEFLIATSLYSLRYWTLSIIIILILYIANYLINKYKEKRYFKPVFIVLMVVFIFVLSFKYYNIASYEAVRTYYYPHKRAQVELANVQWLLLAVEAVNYIEKNSNPGDKMLTLPYDTIYNFISNREQPSRITEFSYISNINTSDEAAIIADMEKKKVKLIMYAIRESDLDSGLGKFGTTHCQKLSKYIKDNYYLDQIFDSKKNNTNFLSPITFYKRKTPFKQDK